MMRRAALFFLALSVAWFVSSCGSRTIGYAVVLWSPDETKLPTGTIIPVFKESQVYDTYTVMMGEELVDVPRWQLALHPSREEAEKAVQEMGEYRTSFATAVVNAARVRKGPGTDQEVVYKLAEGERVKILAPPVVEEESGRLWFKVYTTGGITGFCEASLLKVGTGERQDRSPPAGGAERLTLLQKGPWRPLYFKEMKERGRIDLYRVSPAYGFFVDTETRTITVSVPGRSTRFSYERFLPISDSEFVPEGAPVRIFFRDQETIAVQYPYGTRTYTDLFCLFPDDVNLLISEEMARRESAYRELIAPGSRLVSSSYGILTLNPDKTFRWERPGTLKGRYIPASAAPTGTIELSVLLGEELESRYDGVLVFRFDNTSSEEKVYFLYKKEPGSIRLFYLPASSVVRNVAVSEPRVPVVLYFSYME
ncbi:SH3 domain-containing protein [Spirochaeta thermophila]|nr:SH3 domain-containing protein [Spirochaeta thermophila]